MKARIINNTSHYFFNRSTNLFNIFKLVVCSYFCCFCPTPKEELWTLNSWIETWTRALGRNKVYLFEFFVCISHCHNGILKSASPCFIPWQQCMTSRAIRGLTQHWVSSSINKKDWNIKLLPYYSCVAIFSSIISVVCPNKPILGLFPNRVYK